MLHGARCSLHVHETHSAVALRNRPARLGRGERGDIVDHCDALVHGSNHAGIDAPFFGQVCVWFHIAVGNLVGAMHRVERDIKKERLVRRLILDQARRLARDQVCRVAFLVQRMVVAMDNLRKVIPDAIMVRVSKYGSDKAAALASIDAFTAAMLQSVTPTVRRVLIAGR